MAEIKQADELLRRETVLQPTLDEEVMRQVLSGASDDLRHGRSTFPAEALARHLMYGGTGAYATKVIAAKGGTGLAGPNYSSWWHGLTLPVVLVDQSFAALSEGIPWVLQEIEQLTSSPEFDPQVAPGVWGFIIVRKRLGEASNRLKVDMSGMDTLKWLLMGEAPGTDLYRLAGMLACIRVYESGLKTLLQRSIS